MVPLSSMSLAPRIDRVLPAAAVPCNPYKRPAAGPSPLALVWHGQIDWKPRGELNSIDASY